MGLNSDRRVDLRNNRRRRHRSRRMASSTKGQRGSRRRPVATPTDGYGIVVAPIPEDNGRAFLDFFQDHEFDLGKVGGGVVNWRYLGPPGGTDDVYRGLRNNALLALDEDAGANQRYFDDCHARGGEVHRNREEYRDAIRLFGLEDVPRPLIVARPATESGGGPYAALPIPVMLLDTKPAQRELACRLCKHFNAANLSRFSESGVFTAKSIKRIQVWMDEIAVELNDLVAEASPAAAMSAGPLLVLEELRPEETGARYRTHIVGSGEFAGIVKSLGPRQLFFIEHFFASRDERVIDNRYYTVVSLKLLSAELMRWSELEILIFNGQDRSNPKTRLRKMWGEFVKEMSKEHRLRGIFVAPPCTSDGEYLFLMALRLGQTQSRIKNLATLFTRKG